MGKAKSKTDDEAHKKNRKYWNESHLDAIN